MDNVFIPYVEAKRCPTVKRNQEALCLINVLAAHRQPALKDKLRDNDIHRIHIVLLSEVVTYSIRSCSL